jgi:hypothetical protein
MKYDGKIIYETLFFSGYLLKPDVLIFGDLAQKKSQKLPVRNPKKQLFVASLEKFCRLSAKK